MIHVQNLHHTFGTGPARVEVLHGIDLQIQSGEFVALMGPSGCGKTTLLHILGLITRPTRADSLRLHNTETCRLSDAARTRLRRRHVAFVFQRFNLIPVLSSIENVRLALRLRGSPIDGQPERMLDAVGLGPERKRKPSQLSMGQQQRVAIARAMACQPDLLLADEPTGSLDSENADTVLDLFDRFHTELGLTLVLATHNEAVAGRADRILRMKDGMIGEP